MTATALVYLLTLISAVNGTSVPTAVFTTKSACERAGIDFRSGNTKDFISSYHCDGVVYFKKAK